MKKKYFALAGFVVLCELAGIVGGLFTTPAIKSGPSTGSGLSWYATLARPEFAPPNWVFGPVWTTLYLLMGVSVYLVWATPRGAARSECMKLFFVQLLVNAYWSFAFFGGQSPLAGLIVIITLVCLILATALRFYKLSRPAAWLLAPYLLWVAFATYLNFAIWQLN